MNPKVLALYLPQFYETDYNNKWWGQGYTEWVACKKAKPLFKKHYQPRIPLDGYYNLSDISAIRHQAQLAREYGVDGFAIYHYYFKGKKLLEEPIKLLSENKDIEIEYCLYWANHDWRKNWFGHDPIMLQKQEYGDREDWIQHFNYCLNYFKDERYIKINNKPVFFIFDADHFKQLNAFIDVWNDLARKNGFAGVFFVKTLGPRISKDRGKFDAVFEREPFYAMAFGVSKIWYVYSRVIMRARNYINTILRKFGNGIIQFKCSYKFIWNTIIKEKTKDENTILGAFCDWDNSPRKDYNSFIIEGDPDTFAYYFERQLERCMKQKYPWVIINAWNEWAEGAYLEPDEKYGYGYLKAIKNVIEKNRTKE